MYGRRPLNDARGDLTLSGITTATTSMLLRALFAAQWIEMRSSSTAVHQCRCGRFLSVSCFITAVPRCTGDANAIQLPQLRRKDQYRTRNTVDNGLLGGLQCMRSIKSTQYTETGDETGWICLKPAISTEVRGRITEFRTMSA